ncbi:hypothetical protein [Paraburkholderia sp. EG304]|uniref:hypothetical protein n=1 Tax=Paraburkholderia sp. EG304 TaxID=3237015 RepID=UPI00397D3D92
MPRSRTVKGGFFRSPDIQHTPVACRLLFISLWTQADREGRLEDQPWKIRDEAFPYDQDITEKDVDGMLDVLDYRDLIRRYVVEGQPLIFITKWRTHQHPHPKEAESKLPAPPESPAKARQSRVQFMGAGEFAPGHDLVRTQVQTDRARTSNTSVSSSTSKPSSTSGSSSTSEPATLRAPDASSPALSCVGAREKNSRAARLPEAWVLPKVWGEWATRELGMMREQVLDQAARFADYWHAASGKNAAKLDWFATWRNWCRKARDQGAGRLNGHASFDERAADRKRTVDGLTGRDKQPQAFDVIEVPMREIKHGPRNS